LFHCNYIGIFWTHFHKSPQYQILWKIVQWRLCWYMCVDVGKVTDSCTTVQIHVERWCMWFSLCLERIIIWIDDNGHPTIIYCTCYFFVTNIAATCFCLTCIKPSSGCSNQSYKEENHVKLPVIIFNDNWHVSVT
jgi:hypothetical protein